MNAMHVEMGEIENEPARPKITDAKGILQQNREFLDFFWDIAKPEQEIRLKAIENLIQYLKTSEKVGVFGTALSCSVSCYRVSSLANVAYLSC